MKYELAEQLKDAGFPQEGGIFDYVTGTKPTEVKFKTKEGKEIFFKGKKVEKAYVPTLSELIKACGDRFGSMTKGADLQMWQIVSRDFITDKKIVTGDTPKEAFALFWLVLNK